MGDHASSDDWLRYAHEARYCERVLAKSGLTILTATLPQGAPITQWAHYPDGDVYDAESGAHWFYHCHDDTPGSRYAVSREVEHGHFHCFVRPDGKDGPIHHLVAIGVDPMGRLTRLFSVARHVVDDNDLPPHERVALLDRFDVHLDTPSYLVNRWLTAVVALYQREIAAQIHEGAQRARLDPALDVTAEIHTSLDSWYQTLAG